MSCMRLFVMFAGMCVTWISVWYGIMSMHDAVRPRRPVHPAIIYAGILLGALISSLAVVLE